ncbi:MAG TPA: holo-ACP synthase [Candidatus Paceibacterota bacterium]|nr:holo-ACP synthase [Verrucomicrobiota bacterium]HRY49280.1 holo-ACP synthase [Candidatus Paceibacterota bacterium]HRZ99595.1 holo-ACP synthase [Candidatus Paceibacterota bacterium]
MILGVGIDLIEVDRVERVREKFGDKFLNRILLPEEIRYCLQFLKPGPHIAARFAAKEAISKAFGTGIGRQLSWHDMEVQRRESGEPYVQLHGPGQALLQNRKARALLISLSHTATYATAIAVLES